MDARNAIGDTSLTMKDSVNPSTAKLSMMKINVKNAQMGLLKMKIYAKIGPAKYLMMMQHVKFVENLSKKIMEGASMKI